MIPGCKCDCHVFHREAYPALLLEAESGRLSATAYRTEGDPDILQVFIDGTSGPLAPRLIFIGAFHGEENLEGRVYDVIRAQLQRERSPEVTLRFHEVTQ